MVWGCAVGRRTRQGLPLSLPMTVTSNPRSRPRLIRAPASPPPRRPALRTPVQGSLNTDSRAMLRVALTGHLTSSFQWEIKSIRIRDLSDVVCPSRWLRKSPKTTHSSSTTSVWKLSALLASASCAAQRRATSSLSRARCFVSHLTKASAFTASVSLQHPSQTESLGTN